MPESFRITTSLIRRLRGIMVAIAIFIVLVFSSILVATSTFVKGLTTIHKANIVLSSITQTVEVLESSSANLDKVLESEEARNLKYAFKDSQTSMEHDLKTAAEASHHLPEVELHLKGALASSQKYKESMDKLFARYDKLPVVRSSRAKKQIKRDVVVAQQYIMEIKEQIRKAQTELKKTTDENFELLFTNRYRPTQVAVGLSLLFFAFVVVFGFSITRRIQRSLNNLSLTTKAVMRGNLEVKAEILENDEMGQLTNSFNRMVASLNDKQQELSATLDRMQKLQEITASFSEALTVQQVCEVTVGSTFKALGAQVGSIALLNEDGEKIEVKKFLSNAGAISPKWRNFNISEKTPSTEAIHYQQAIFISNPQELKERFPLLVEEYERLGIQSLVSVPLVMASETLGGMTFSFSTPKDFTDAEQKFIIALSRQCAQALHRAQLYDEAKASVQSRDEFISIASHEMKTPLTPLKLQLQMIERQITRGSEIDKDKLTDLIRNSDHHIKRLSKLIEDLLDVSRITLKTLSINYQKVNLGELIKEVIKQYGHQLRDALLKVNLKLEDDIWAEVDKIRIEQVLINLLTNAAKYAPGKPIEITLEKRGNRARISVKDEGPGIAEENQRRIFNRFERVRNTDNVGGLGLGLYISSQIVESHQGTFWVESEISKGSTFIFELPLEKAVKKESLIPS